MFMGHAREHHSQISHPVNSRNHLSMSAIDNFMCVFFQNTGHHIDDVRSPPPLYVYGRGKTLSHESEIIVYSPCLSRRRYARTRRPINWLAMT